MATNSRFKTQGRYHMKKLGIVGGIGPASTIEYYKRINEGY